MQIGLYKFSTSQLELPQTYFVVKVEVQQIVDWGLDSDLD